jgi:hypothetical protein
LQGRLHGDVGGERAYLWGIELSDLDDLDESGRRRRAMSTMMATPVVMKEPCMTMSTAVARARMAVATAAKAALTAAVAREATVVATTTAVLRAAIATMAMAMEAMVAARAATPVASRQRLSS